MIDIPKGSDKYPALAYLFDAWFHQDADIYGDTLEEILPHYIRVTAQEKRWRVVADIDRLMQHYSESDESLLAAVNSIFDPEVAIDGWEGLTSREWLLRVKALIL